MPLELELLDEDEEPLELEEEELLLLEDDDELLDVKSGRSSAVAVRWSPTNSAA